MKTRKRRILRILLLVGILIVFISIVKQIENIKKDSYIKLIINNQEILVDINNKQEIFDLETLNSEYDTIVKIELKNAQIRINQQTIQQTKEISLGKVDIQEENKIILETKLLGESNWKKYTINTLPSQFPSYEFEGESQEEGDYYITTYELQANKSQHYIYKLNQVGKVVFYKATPKVCYNFKKNCVDNEIRYTYLESFGYLSEGFTLSLPTKLVVLDQQYNKINEIYYFNQEEDKGRTDEDRKLDNHDYLYLADNHYILAGFEKKTVFNFPNHKKEPFDVWNCKIQEVIDGKIVWEFESIKNENIYHYCNEKNTKVMTLEPTLDYMHFNSMAIDEKDGNLICSFRNIDAIMKIDRKTGNVIWVLGGVGDEFSLKNEQQFSNQHSLSFLSNHAILIYDNGCSNKKTRILKIQLDEKNKKIQDFKHYDLESFSIRMGSVQTVNEQKNTYLITYGVGKRKYGFQEINLETLEPIASFKLKESNSLYCVNKYK